MRINQDDIIWLAYAFPNLIYDQNNEIIRGELDFCALYSKETDTLQVYFNQDCGNLTKGICDVFEIEIWLTKNLALSANWPTVYEIGGRHESISKRLDIPLIDLHFYNGEQSCCLGIYFVPIVTTNIRSFILNVVIPFFYRLAYVDRFGLQAARDNLWGEYSHGEKGFIEYANEILELEQSNVGRNEPCPCGSRNKYKKCHLNEVKATASWLRAP